MKKYKKGKNRKIIISFDSSGELLVLWDKRVDEVVTTSDPSMYNWFRGRSSFVTPIPFWNPENYEWRYR